MAKKNVEIISPLSRSLRLYLYITAAVTGAAIMVIEILGAKMLAPYLGTSHFVWTAQIAVTLIALAVGYYAGGWLVDRSAKPSRMYVSILIAALYLAFVIRFVEPVAYWSLQFKLASGSLIASTFLFFVPLALLAMTGPFFIRVLTVAVAGVGGNVGRLSAISTGGSFAGTILIGYVLIPFFPNSITMYITAGILVLVVLIYFVAWGRRAQLAGAAMIGVGAMGIGYFGVLEDARPRVPNASQIYRANSNFGQLQVIEFNTTDRRAYLNDFLIQNTFDPVTKQSTSMFTYMLYGLSRGYTTKLNDVLCIGMGIGIVPMQLAAEGTRVDVVEINPAAIPVAVKYFNFHPEKVNILIDDGRHHVNATEKQYDAVILDAFLGDASPSHLMSQEAFAAMKRCLRPTGVLVINSFCDFDPAKDYLASSLDKTLKSVFPAVRIHAGHESGNVFFVACNGPDLRLQRPFDFDSVHPYSRDDVEQAFATIRTADPQHGIVLRDDYNPIEYYDADNREDYRREMAMWMGGK